MTVYTLSELTWSTNMQQIYIGVILTVPDNMTMEQACAEVKTSIDFGQAEVVPFHAFPIPEDHTTSQ
jgi:hypothetical protein